MVFSFLTVFHRFNRFLSTPGGELLKRSSELIILTFASYMVASEWLRTKSKHLKYLLIGFGSLALQKLVATIFLAHIVFVGITLVAYTDIIILTENFLEIAALVLISSAFLYPVHEKHHISLRKKTYIELASVAAVFAFSGAVAFDFFPFLPFGIKRKLIFSSMELIKFAILMFPIFIFWQKKELSHYNKSVALAFITYSITPFLNFINLVVYYGRHTDLTVLAHPFPFLAIALFTRVLFLKLVDKATLKEELTVTRQKYIHEKEVSSMKDEFVSTVSHELRTPLTSIRLYLSLLLQGKFGQLNDKQQETLATVNRESNRLTRLISDILDLSKFERNKEQLSIKNVNLFKLVQSGVYPHLLEEKNITLVNTIPSDLTITVDSDKFKQVIINLLTNAAKFTGESGTITIKAQKKGTKTILLVSDTGCGIKPEALPYIFDKFYQADGHMSRKAGGLGLGLAIVKQIVDLHKGTITVKSRVNRGTTFTITLPDLEEKLNEHQDTVTRETTSS